MHGLKQINFQNEKAVADAIMASKPVKDIDEKLDASFKQYMAEKAKAKQVK